MLVSRTVIEVKPSLKEEVKVSNGQSSKSLVRDTRGNGTKECLVKSVLVLAMLFIAPSFAPAAWVLQQQTTGHYYSVHFPVDALTGYIAGDYGTVVKTTNGGSNWLPVNVRPLSYFDLRSVNFVDAMTGYVVGDSMIAPTWCKVFKTTNGGASWTVQFTDVGTTFSSIQFPVDANTGYAVGTRIGGGSNIIKTTNGGSTWDTLPGTPSTLSSVYFPRNATTGYAVGGPYPYQILKTTNGGTTWTASQNVPTAYSPGSVHFPIDPDTGYAVADSGIILKTTTGGTSWYKLNSGTTRWLTSVQFPNAQTGYVCGSSGYPDSSILKTTNGGQTWIKQPKPTQNFMHSINFPVDAGVGYCVGDFGTILKTQDGGSGVEETPEDRGRKPEVGLKTTPNPFTAFTTVPGHEREQFALYDLSGKRLGTYSGTRIGEGLPAGVYFIASKTKDSMPIRTVKVR